jgi:hypothetical protein
VRQIQQLVFPENPTLVVDVIAAATLSIVVAMSGLKV